MEKSDGDSMRSMDGLPPGAAHHEPPARLGTPGRVALAFFAAAAAYFLWTEHRAHVIAHLPWGILALCPLMHFFVHRGHGSHDPGPGSRLDLFSHEAGHLWHTFFGWEGDPHFDPFHLLSYLLIGGGFSLPGAGWPVLYRAQREGRLATTGAYARVRHPQYT